MELEESTYLTSGSTTKPQLSRQYDFSLNPFSTLNFYPANPFAVQYSQRLLSPLLSLFSAKINENKKLGKIMKESEVEPSNMIQHTSWVLVHYL